MQKVKVLRLIIFGVGCSLIVATPVLGFLFGDLPWVGTFLIVGWGFLVICTLTYFYYLFFHTDK